jgi:hypothetical protein
VCRNDGVRRGEDELDDFEGKLEANGQKFLKIFTIYQEVIKIFSLDFMLFFDENRLISIKTYNVILNNIRLNSHHFEPN